MTITYTKAFEWFFLAAPEINLADTEFDNWYEFDVMINTITTISFPL